MLRPFFSWLVACVLQPVLQVLCARLRAGLKVTGAALAHVVRPDDSVRFCVNKGDAGGLRAFDASAVGEEAASNFASGGLWLLFHRCGGKNVVCRFRRLYHLCVYVLLGEGPREVGLETVLWSDVDFRILDLRVASTFVAADLYGQALER